MSLGNILVRADASPEIGTGHVMRCLALAQAWQDAGGNAVFLMAESTPAVCARLASGKCDVVSNPVFSGSADDAARTREWAERHDVEWVVVDGYSLGAGYQEQVRSGGRKLLCIDDGGECDYYVADIVLNQNLNASEKFYRRCGADTKLLLGPGFSLLRREFVPWRKWQREISASGRHVLVTLGGSTPTEIGVRVMESLGSVNIEGLRVVFVVGGSTPDETSLESCAAKFPGTITIRRDVSNMATIMSEADVAISAAGSTCWELCFLGVPSILLDVAGNQTPVALELCRQACALYAGRANNISVAELAKSVENLLTSHETRESLSRRSRQLVDGFGAPRVVSAMRNPATEPVVGITRGARA
jgi:UDP-2,4-diacetamido-2,4,6-trideoxy-beta-L-altropyranose hydrolase